MLNKNYSLFSNDVQYLVGSEKWMLAADSSKGQLNLTNGLCHIWDRDRHLTSQLQRKWQSLRKNSLNHWKAFDTAILDVSDGSSYFFSGSLLETLGLSHGVVSRLSRNPVNLCFSVNHLNHFPSYGMLVTQPREEEKVSWYWEVNELSLGG